MQHDISPLSKNGEVISVFNNGTGMNNLSNNEFSNSFIVISNLPINQINKKPSIFFGRDLDNFGLKFKEYKLDFLPNVFKPKTRTQGLGKISNDERFLFIEENNQGRLMEIDLEKEEILWQYLNKSKNNTRLMMSWSRKLDKLPIEKSKLNNLYCDSSQL